MTEFLYFLAGILVAVLGIAITLRVQPQKRLCGYVESTKTFDKDWVFSAESVRFLYNDIEADQVIHHVFYVWNGGSSAVRSIDLPAGYLARIRFSDERVGMVDLKKVGTAFDASIRVDEGGWLIVADHIDRGHGLWCHFVEPVPVGKDPVSITIEGYVIEGGEILTEVRPVPTGMASRMLLFPASFLLMATVLSGLSYFGNAPEQTQTASFVLTGVLLLILGTSHSRWVRDFFSGYRYRVPSEFGEIVGRFQPSWSKQDVESRLGVRFPN